MATVHNNLTVGKSYAVTTAGGCTITDEDGNTVKVIAANSQGVFVAQTPSVTLSDDNALFTLVFNSALALDGNGGGGSITIDPAPTQGSENAVSSGGVYTALRELPAPVPEPLGTTTTLLHGHVYTLAVEADTDLSAIAVAQYATCELWLDYSAGSVTWPTLWSWVDGIVPTFTASNRYFVRVWSDGVAVIAKLEYSYANA